MRLLTLKATTNEYGALLAERERPTVYVNPNRICGVWPDDRTGGSMIELQDGNIVGVTAVPEELERRFEEITSPGKSKVLRVVAKYLKEGGGAIGVTVDQAKDPESYATLARYLAETK